MHRIKWFCFLLVGLVAIHLFPVKAMGNVAVFCLDTSGSMKHHGFEAAKNVLIEHINATKQGEVIYVIAFHTNDYLLGRLAVGENSNKDREALINKVKELKADGKYTNIDEPLQAAKGPSCLKRELQGKEGLWCSQMELAIHLQTTKKLISRRLQK